MEEKILQIDDLEFEILINEKVLQQRVKELAKQISNDYKRKVPIFVGVLRT